MSKKKKSKAKRPPNAASKFNAKAVMKATTGVGHIVQEIINELQITVATLGKTFQPGALDEWRGKLAIAIVIKLSLGGNWTTDRTKVLAVAHDMGVIAALLSGAMPTISKARVHAAFRAVKDHQTCPTPPGSGAWCNFDI